MNRIDTDYLRLAIRGKYKTNKLFADEIGISEGTLSLILNNRVRPSYDVMSAMVEKLNIPANIIKSVFFNS